MTTITTLPPAPSRSDTAATFVAKSDAFLAAQAQFVTETNAVAAQVSADATTATTASTTAANNATIAVNAAAAATASSTSAASSSVSAASDRAQTGLDRTASDLSASSASASAATATTQAAAATAAAAGASAIVMGVATLLPASSPSLLLDFANAQSLDPRATFTRASTATRINSLGLIESAAVNAPRFDFDPATLACRGLLVEEQCTNLLTYSEQFDNAAWTKTGSTISANAVIAPDGTMTADKLVESATTALHRALQDCVTSGTVLNTCSVFAKAGERSAFYMVMQDSAASNAVQALFDLAAGTVQIITVSGLGSTASASIVPYSNGWYRCLLSGICGSGTSVRQNIELWNGTAVTYAGDGTSGLYIWGAQLEAGAFPTSYIATTSAQATRAADLASLTGANFSSWFNAREGAFAVTADSASFGAGTTRYVFLASNAAGTEYVTAYFRSGVKGVAADVVAASVSQAFLPSVNTAYVEKTLYTSTVGYKADDFAASHGGAAAVTDTSGQVPTVDRLFLGRSASGSITLNGHIARLAYYPKRVTNTELIALSA